MHEADAKTRIIETFRALVVSEGYADVTVSQMCSEAHISKRTFYKYFETKQSLLEEIVRRDTVEPSLLLLTALFSDQQADVGPLIMQTTFNIIYENKEFYQALLSNNSKSSLRKIMNDQLYHFANQLFIQGPGQKHVQGIELDYVCWFFASSTISTLEWWCNHHFQPEPKEMARIYETWTFAGNRELGYFTNHAKYSRAGQ